MFQLSHYSNHAFKALDSYQRNFLQWTDATVFLRELSKVSSGFCATVSVSSVIFGFNPTTPATFAAISLASWALSAVGARKMESEAQDMIKSFDGFWNARKNQITRDQARDCGLVD